MIKKNTCLAAVCLTKFGSESGETAKEVLARKDLERRSGVGAHKNEFWWGVGEKGIAQSIQTLISQHGGNIVLFSAIKDQKPPNKGSATDALVWRKFRMLGGDILQDKIFAQPVFCNPNPISTDARSAPEPCHNRPRMRMACHRRQFAIRGSVLSAYPQAL